MKNDNFDQVKFDQVIICQFQAPTLITMKKSWTNFWRNLFLTELWRTAFSQPLRPRCWRCGRSERGSQRRFWGTDTVTNTTSPYLLKRYLLTWLTLNWCLCTNEIFETPILLTINLWIKFKKFLFSLVIREDATYCFVTIWNKF